MKSVLFALCLTVMAPLVMPSQAKVVEAPPAVRQAEASVETAVEAAVPGPEISAPSALLMEIGRAHV